MEKRPVLYILMRSDMESMNPGKAMAQAAHAANAFMHEVHGREDDVEGYMDWLTSTDQGFGTTITVDIGGEYELTNMVAKAKNEGWMADTILDPTYPVLDGRVTHLIPVVTCGYIFTPTYPILTFKDVLKLPLHK